MNQNQRLNWLNWLFARVGWKHSFIQTDYNTWEPVESFTGWEQYS